jgi:hypothetical protein
VDRCSAVPVGCVPAFRPSGPSLKEIFFLFLDFFELIQTSKIYLSHFRVPKIMKSESLDS